jgi:hypothetical protein
MNTGNEAELVNKEWLQKSEKIESILVDAWNEFKKNYDKKAPEYLRKYLRQYSNSLGNRKKVKAKDDHWICWNESDLMVLIGHFVYKQIEEESDLQDIELHFDKRISLTNFEDYDFKGNLPKLKEKLGRFPKVDLIITQEDKLNPFLLCAEAKLFHYELKTAGGQKDIVDAIEKDIKTLLTIKELDIAKKVVFILFDDYYYLHAQQELEKIGPLLSEFELDNNTILRHNTQAKKSWNET